MRRFEEVKSMSKEALVDWVYNTWCSANSNDSDYENSQFENGKKIPYIGWFWRDTGFFNKVIYIGSADGYIGVMENNKWDYPKRRMSKEEVDKFIELLDAAIEAGNAGGILAEILENQDKKFIALCEWMQGLKI